MVEDFVPKVTYLEYFQNECMNDNHIFHNNNLQEQKEIQLHHAHHRLSSENISCDTTVKPDRPN